MTTVADLQAFLGANVSGFVSGMHESSSAVRGLGSDVQSVSGHVKTGGQAAHDAGDKFDGMGKQVKGLKNETDALGPSMEKSSGLLKTIAGTAGGFVVAQGLMKLPGLFSGFIGGASDLNESMSKMQTVFGESSGEIAKFADGAAKNLGMSRQAALEATGTFGNFLQAMGATRPAATDMSQAMVLLATDLGSFNNANPEEVLLALRSGLSGESEPLRKFGVALSEAAVQAKATEMGLSAVGGELTEQQKIQARYAIIMAQTTTAQGDFARTSGGLANQTKILKSMWADASAQLGTALLPGIVAAAQAMIQFLPAIISVAGAIGENLMSGIRGLVGFVGGMLVPVLKSAAAFIHTGMTVAFQALGKAIDYVSGPIEDFVGTMRGLVATDFKTGHIVQGFKDVGFAILELAYELGIPGPIIDGLMEKWYQFIDVVAEFSSGAAAGAVVIFQELVAGAEALWPTIKSLAEEGFGLLAQGIQKVVAYWNQLPPWAKTAIEIGLVAGAVVAVVGPFVALGAAVLYVVGRWDELNAKFPIIGQSIDKVKEALDVLVKQFEKFRNDVLPALQNVAVGIAAVVALFAMPFIAAGIAIEQTIREHFDAIMGIVNPALNLVKTVIETDLKMIRDVFSIAFALLRGDWSGAWDGLKTLVSDAFNGIKAVVKAEIDLTIGIIKNMPILILALVSNFVNVFNEIGQKMIEGLSAALTGGWADVRNAIWSMKDSAIGGLGNVADWLIGAGQDLVRGLVSGIESMAGWLTEKLRSWAGGVVGDVLGAFGINSPARTMIPVGEGILEGVGVGIDNGTAGVTSKLSSLSQNLVAAAVSTVAKVNAAMAQAGTASGGPMVTPGTWGNGTGSGTAAGPATSGIKPDKNGNIPGKAGYDVVQQPDGSYGYAVHNYGGTAPGLPIKQANGTYFTDSAANHPGQHWGGSGWVSDTVPVAAVSSGASATGGTSYEDAVKAAGGTVAAAGTNVGPLQTTVSLTIAGDVNITASDPTSWDTQVSALGYGVMSNLRARGLA